MPAALGQRILCSAQVLTLFAAACSHHHALLYKPPVVQSNATDESTCGMPLAYFEIIAIVKGGIRAVGGDPSELEKEYLITVRPNGCDYDVLGIRVPETIPQEFFMTIDRSGRIKSWPWCCV